MTGPLLPAASRWSCSCPKKALEEEYFDFFCLAVPALVSIHISAYLSPYELYMKLSAHVITHVCASVLRERHTQEVKKGCR